MEEKFELLDKDHIDSSQPLLIEESERSWITGEKRGHVTPIGNGNIVKR